MKYNKIVAFIFGCLFFIFILLVGVGVSHLFISFIFWDLSYHNWSWVGKLIYFILCFFWGYFGIDYFKRMFDKIKSI